MVLHQWPFWARKDWNKAWTGEAALVLIRWSCSFCSCPTSWFDPLWAKPVDAAESGGLAIFGFADIPLVHIAVASGEVTNPQVVARGGLPDEMWLALAVALLAFVLLFSCLFWLRVKQGLIEEALEDFTGSGIEQLLMER